MYLYVYYVYLICILTFVLYICTENEPVSDTQKLGTCSINMEIILASNWTPCHALSGSSKVHTVKRSVTKNSSIRRKHSSLTFKKEMCFSTVNHSRSPRRVTNLKLDAPRVVRRTVHIKRGNPGLMVFCSAPDRRITSNFKFDTKIDAGTAIKAS